MPPVRQNYGGKLQRHIPLKKKSDALQLTANVTISDSRRRASRYLKVCPYNRAARANFIFREVRKEIASGRQVRVFAYRQVHPCDAVAYHFGLPAQFADSPMLQAGELALDAETGQIVREERNVYIGNLDKKPTRVARIAMGYGESRFGVLVPKTIVVETFLPREGVNGMSTGFQPYARMVQTYGPFSRFEVSVGEKVSAPTH